MNAEAVRDAEHFAGMQILLDVFFVKFALRLVGREHMDPVGALAGFLGRDHHHAIGPRLRRALPGGVKTHDDFEAAVAQILRLRVSLAAVAKDGDGFALQGIGVGVAFIKNVNHQRAPLVSLQLVALPLLQP
jgi:hypothetical protein